MFRSLMRRNVMLALQWSAPFRDLANWFCSQTKIFFFLLLQVTVRGVVILWVPLRFIFEEKKKFLMATTVLKKGNWVTKEIQGMVVLRFHTFLFSERKVDKIDHQPAVFLIFFVVFKRFQSSKNRYWRDYFSAKNCTHTKKKLWVA